MVTQETAAKRTTRGPSNHGPVPPRLLWTVSGRPTRARRLTMGPHAAGDAAEGDAAADDAEDGEGASEGDDANA